MSEVPLYLAHKAPRPPRTTVGLWVSGLVRGTRGVRLLVSEVPLQRATRASRRWAVRVRPEARKAMTSPTRDDVGATALAPLLYIGQMSARQVRAGRRGVSECCVRRRVC